MKFYQGTENLLVNIASDKQMEFVKKRIGSFFDMKNINFLFGSGTSTPAIPKMKGLLDAVETDLPDKSIFDVVKLAKGDNLEEILGVLYSQRAYLEGVQKEDEEECAQLKKCKDTITSIETIIFDKLNIGADDKNYSEVLECYKAFYRKMAMRNKDHSRISVFTTNNDLFNERALDSLNIHYINGFAGGLNRFFNPALFNYTMSKRMDTSIDKFEPIENLIYLYKIHGSVNWVEDEDATINNYFKIRELNEPSKEKTVLIYPTPMKQNKSLGSPYVDLFREFQHKLLEPNTVLFIIGYSFSDEHVNDIIYRALATNSTMNLVIFGSVANKPIAKIGDNRIFRFFEDERPEDKNPLHYFDRIVDELLPDLDAFRHDDDLLRKFVEELNVARTPMPITEG